MSTTVETAPDIRSFQIEIPQEQIDDLRQRIAATRWPTRSSSRTGPRACSWLRCRARHRLDDRVRLAR